MAISKATVIDRIEILEDGVIQVRQALRAFDDDGTQIGQRFHRFLYVPTTALAEIPFVKVRAIANLVWTPQVIADYRAANPTS